MLDDPVDDHGRVAEAGADLLRDGDRDDVADLRGPPSFLSTTMSPVLIVGDMLADITVASGGQVRR